MLHVMFAPPLGGQGRRSDHLPEDGRMDHNTIIMECYRYSLRAQKSYRYSTPACCPAPQPQTLSHSLYSNGSPPQRDINLLYRTAKVAARPLVLEIDTLALPHKEHARMLHVH